MSTGFIARWSLRKRTAARRISTDSATARQSERGPPVEQENSSPSPRAPEPTSAADSATTSAANADPIAKIAAAGNLPALDSITAETDIRAFLAAGVPQDLARAALRRAWSADPAIRDYVGLAENSWDFNNPAAIPGFGTLDVPPELRRALLEAANWTTAPEPQQPRTPPVAIPVTEKPGGPDHPDLTRSQALPAAESAQPQSSTPAHAAMQQTPKKPEAPPRGAASGRRIHGRALPQ